MTVSLLSTYRSSEHLIFVQSSLKLCFCKEYPDFPVMFEKRGVTIFLSLLRNILFVSSWVADKGKISHNSQKLPIRMRFFLETP